MDLVYMNGEISTGVIGPAAKVVLLAQRWTITVTSNRSWCIQPNCDATYSNPVVIQIENSNYLSTQSGTGTLAVSSQMIFQQLLSSSFVGQRKSLNIFSTSTNK